MRTTSLLQVGVAMGLILVMASASWGEPTVAHRQVRQQKRIAQGLRSGQITDGEFLRLNREQGRIESFRQRAWADGYLSSRERHRLDAIQNKASRHIYRVKQNRKRYCGDRPAPRSIHRHRHERLQHLRHESYFSGFVSQPEWSVTWAMNLR